MEGVGREGRGEGRGGETFFFPEYDLKVAYIMSIDIPFAKSQSCSHISCEGSK